MVYLSDSNVSGTRASEVGCGLPLRAFPIRFRVGIEAGSGEANSVGVWFDFSRAGDGCAWR
ncbi:MAG: hypothetical protein DME89_08620 [Verrucomicrobia bacterium]|nr:MAG: hypothetical protein DME89_08620 [Verrucomicrobiota bacterium]PYL51377.1 MAG: hypothetical protein DMF33_10785 [Verrucomicrobiota bacterium]